MTVRLWDISSNVEDALLKTWDHHTEFAIGIDFSIHEPGVVGSVGWDGQLYMWHHDGNPRDWDSRPYYLVYNYYLGRGFCNISDIVQILGGILKWIESKMFLWCQGKFGQETQVMDNGLRKVWEVNYWLDDYNHQKQLWIRIDHCSNGYMSQNITLVELIGCKQLLCCFSHMFMNVVIRIELYWLQFDAWFALSLSIARANSSASVKFLFNTPSTHLVCQSRACFIHINTIVFCHNTKDQRVLASSILGSLSLAFVRHAFLTSVHYNMSLWPEFASKVSTTLKITHTGESMKCCGTQVYQPKENGMSFESIPSVHVASNRESLSRRGFSHSSCCQKSRR